MKKTVVQSAVAAVVILAGCGEQTTAKPSAKTAPAKKPAQNVVTAYPAAAVKSLKRANTMACSNNLKQLYMSLNMFNMDNNRFPKANGVAGLQELVSQQNYPTSMLCCPAKRPGELTEKATAFLYLGGLATPGDRNLPVAIEKPGRHGDNTTVLFANGAVKNFTIPNYTSVTQVIQLAVPAGARAKYLEAVRQIEKQQ